MSMATQEDLIEAVRASMRDDEEASVLTIKDISEIAGICEAVVRRQLKKMLENGDVVVCDFKRRNLIGVVTTMRGFRLINKNTD